jgi:phosphoglucosamine mutase
MEHIFRAYDIRGVYGRDLTPELVRKIGLSFGAFLGNKGKVVVGRDARNSGPELLEAFSEGLNCAGVDTTDIGMVPTPVLNYWCGKTGATAGVVLSASHNPPEYNGIRFRQGDGIGWTDCIPRVKDILFSGTYKEDKEGRAGKGDTDNVVDDYIDYLTSRIPIPNPIRVVVDPGNGAACGVGAKMFEKAGCEVVAINDEPDGNFPGRGPHPNEKTLGGLQDEVKKSEADFGVAYDGDADRVVFVDDLGRVKSAEEMGVVFVRDILSRLKNREVALNVDCSMAVEEEVIKLGGSVKRIRVGDVFLAQACKDGAVFAMESSSHYVVPEYFPFDDGILMSLFAAEIISSSGKKLSELTSGVPKYPVLRKEVEAPDDRKFLAIEKLAERFKEKDPITIDGVKVIFENGWALARASNTQPMIRVTVEGKTERVVKEMMGEMEKAVRKALL